MIIKLTGQEQTVNTTPVEINSRVIRCLLDAGAGVTANVTFRDSSNNIVGTITIEARTDYVFEKDYTDTIESDVNILAVPIAYSVS